MAARIAEYRRRIAHLGDECEPHGELVLHAVDRERRRERCTDARRQHGKLGGFQGIALFTELGNRLGGA